MKEAATEPVLRGSQMSKPLRWLRGILLAIYFAGVFFIFLAGMGAGAYGPATYVGTWRHFAFVSLTAVSWPISVPFNLRMPFAPEWDKNPPAKLSQNARQKHLRLELEQIKNTLASL